MIPPMPPSPNVAGDRIANGDGRRQEHQRDGETDATTTKQLAKFPPGSHESLTEVLVNRVAKDSGFAGLARSSFEVDHQRPWRIRREIAGPVDDEFLGSRVEVAFAER